MMKTENVEQIQRLKEDYSRQMQESRYEKLLNQCSAADQEIIKTLASLNTMSGGKLDKLYMIYKTIR
jgi:hypothetical protein